MSYTGAEVAALRTSMGLSQDQLAAVLGINRTTPRDWELGRTLMSESSAAAFEALAMEHAALVDEYAQCEDVIGVVRDVDAQPGDRPRSWYLAAVGQALQAEPDLMVDWA